MPNISDVEIRKTNEKVCRFLNHRTRLEHALDITLKKLGLSATKRKIIIKEVKENHDFSFIDLI